VSRCVCPDSLHSRDDHRAGHACRQRSRLGYLFTLRAIAWRRCSPSKSWRAQMDAASASRERLLELLWDWRFDKMNVEAGCSRPVDIFGSGVPSERHQRRLPQCMVGPHPARDLVAIHPRQADVAQDDVRPERLCLLKSFRSGERDFNRVAAELKHLAEALVVNRAL